MSEDDFKTYGELEAYVKKELPDYAHTLEWEEHPEEYGDTCFCELCRSYMRC